MKRLPGHVLNIIFAGWWGHQPGLTAVGGIPTARNERIIRSTPLVVLALNIFLVCLCGCRQKTDPVVLEKFFQHQLPHWNEKLTQVIISDIFSPPVCGRIYAYTN